MPSRMRREAEAAAIAITDHVARHSGSAAAADGDSGHLISEDVIIDDGPLAVLAHEDTRVAPVVYPIALDERTALLEDGHAGATVAKDVIFLHPTAAALGDEHPRIHAVVNLVGAHERVPSREDGDAGASVARDRVVLDDALGVVAHEHAHALAILHLVVHNVSARISALHHDAVPRLRGDHTLLENQKGAALDEDRPRHGGAVALRALL